MHKLLADFYRRFIVFDAFKRAHKHQLFAANKRLAAGVVQWWLQINAIPLTATISSLNDPRVIWHDVSPIKISMVGWVKHLIRG
ncbi:hypothetical protein A7A09_014080 [Paracoccus methylarcula]|uniref:Uncharacterized protein n=1 Tax=Paracoccus methylarcula TaxID=72022 RepID=A0A3R7PP64_9RHOB|nr:hypothetical protein A7A09_014080 [Paracoccus methylarcula]